MRVAGRRTKPKRSVLYNKSYMEDLLDFRSRRSRAVADLEAWIAQTRKSHSPAQVAASAALTDEEVNRLVHEAR